MPLYNYVAMGPRYQTFSISANFGFLSSYFKDSSSLALAQIDKFVM